MDQTQVVVDTEIVRKIERDVNRETDRIVSNAVRFLDLSPRDLKEFRMSTRRKLLLEATDDVTLSSNRARRRLDRRRHPR